MTLLARASAGPRAQVLRRLDTGVRRLAGSEAVPVILLPDLPEEVVAALAPLLARRREVFALDSHDTGELDATDVGATAVAVVGGALGSAAARLVGAGVEALVVVDPEGRAEAVPYPMLIVRMTGAPAGESAGHAHVAASGHPVETAHLIDSFLRDPRRAGASARLVRARP